jgi:N-acetylglucosamine-6-phosphate deacetylase
MLYISGADILTPMERLTQHAVLIDGDRIAAVAPEAELPLPEGAKRLGLAGGALVPGFIDLQVNGAFGHDFTATPGCIWDVAADCLRYGITGFLPTIITSPLETVREAQRILSDRPAGFAGAEPLGLHCEGPFLNPGKKGAHNPAYLRSPSLEAVQEWSPKTGVRLVTLAPELPGATDVIRELVRRGVTVSAGHSLATYDETQAGLDAGITYGTHLFNAMPALAHRDPALPGALLTDPRATCGFIPDAIHTHPALIRLVWQALGPRRMNVVTDCMAALGMPPGRHRLADYDVVVDETSARLSDGTLAGSILSLDQGLRNLISQTSCSLEEALQTVTTTPARVLGLAQERGQIAPGFVADLIWLTPDLHVQKTIAAGNVVYGG